MNHAGHAWLPRLKTLPRAAGGVCLSVGPGRLSPQQHGDPAQDPNPEGLVAPTSAECQSVPCPAKESPSQPPLDTQSDPSPFTWVGAPGLPRGQWHLPLPLLLPSAQTWPFQVLRPGGLPHSLPRKPLTWSPSWSEPDLERVPSKTPHVATPSPPLLFRGQETGVSAEEGVGAMGRGAVAWRPSSSPAGQAYLTSSGTEQIRSTAGPELEQGEHHGLTIHTRLQATLGGCVGLPRWIQEYRARFLSI